VARKAIQRKTRTTTKAPEGEFEVVEQETVKVEKPAKAPMGTEGMLVTITFFALVAAFVLINMGMRRIVGHGWPV